MSSRAVIIWNKKKNIISYSLTIIFMLILFSAIFPFSTSIAQEESQEQTVTETEEKLAEEEEGDSEVEITADEVDYDKENDQMIFNGNVIILQEDTTLTARKASFNVDTKVGQIEEDVKLVQEDITITGINLEAFLNDKKYIFEDNVKLIQIRSADEEEDKEDEEVIWTCSMLEILTETKDMTAKGNVEISKTDYIIRAEEAIYNDQEEKITLTNSVRIEELESERWIEGDNAVFYLDTDKLEVKGNVKSSMKLD